MPARRNLEAPQDSFLRRFLQLAVLTGLAVAQPIYDLLAGTPEFLVVHGAALRETLALAFGLSLALPLAWAGLTQLVTLRSDGLDRFLHAGSVYLLASLFFLQVGDLGRGAAPGRALFAAAVLTLGFALLDQRTDLVRSFLLLLTPAILVFPALFLTGQEVRAVLIPPSSGRMGVPPVQSDTPVVFVVFDGLPLTSLLEGERRIDPVRYPAFERLARSATWFPRATTVADNTLEALPALLSGRYPEEPLPTTAYYPHNLFTLLAGSHRMVVDEPLTDLCPSDLCPEPRLTFIQRMGALVADLGVIYLHLVAPDRLGHRLPQVQTSWRGFLALGSTHQGEVDRAERFREFIGRVSAADGPGLFFIHSELPHAPHAHLPNGNRYTASDNEPSGEGRQFAWWSDDVQAVTHSYQRHLLQVGFADHLLGELLAALDRAGLFDEALIVVTSDHGVSFHPERSRRMLEDGNAHDVLSIPMFLKLPNQGARRTDERRVRVIDLLPTITDVLGADRMDGIDGHSLVDSGWPGREGAFASPIDEVTFDDQGRRSLTLKLESFGTGSSHGSFVRADPFPALVGRETAPWADLPMSPLRVEASLETGSGLVPIQITGTITRAKAGHASPCLAVAGDGVVRATTCAYRGRAGSPTAPWSVLLEEPLEDPESLQVFVVAGEPGEERVERGSAPANPSPK
jgi:hypothetical protein